MELWVRDLRGSAQPVMVGHGSLALHELQAMQDSTGGRQATVELELARNIMGGGDAAANISSLLPRQNVSVLLSVFRALVVFFGV